MDKKWNIMRGESQMNEVHFFNGFRRIGRGLKGRADTYYARSKFI